MNPTNLTPASESGDYDAAREYRRIQRQFRGAAAAAVFVLSSGAVFYHFVEGLRWLDAFYFCTVTLTTIGYGDFVPKTDGGKVFTMVYVLIGIGILAFFANIIIKNAVLRRELRLANRKRR